MAVQSRSEHCFLVTHWQDYPDNEIHYHQLACLNCHKTFNCPCLLTHSIYYSVWELGQLQINQLHPPPQLWIEENVCTLSVCLQTAVQAFVPLAVKAQRILGQHAATRWAWGRRLSWHVGGSGRELVIAQTQRGNPFTDGIKQGFCFLFFLPPDHSFLFVTEWDNYLWFSISVWRIDGSPCPTYQHAAVVNVLSLSANEVSNVSCFPGEKCRSFLYVAPSNERGKSTRLLTALSNWC